MLDIALLHQTLTPKETPGLDTLDPRFQEIAGRVEAGEFEKAAEDTQALLLEGIVDVRVISYFLYGCFLQNGLAGVGDIFQALVGLFGPNWPAVGPASKREKHTESGVSWFLTRLHKKLQAVEESKDDEWKKWQEQVNAEGAQAIQQRSGEVRAAMGAVNLPSTKCADALRGVDEWLDRYASTVAVAPPPPPEPEPESAAPDAPASREGGAAPVAAVPGATAAGMVEGSFHLDELRAKIRAFEVLCQKREFQRAAVVLQDVTNAIEHFDPRLYLPKTFASFYRHLALNVADVAPLLEQRDSAQWKAMEQLYRVSLEGFVS